MSSSTPPEQPDPDAQSSTRTGRVRRRAGRACLGCRARKVRCDVLQKDPCSNCRLDRIQCVVPRSRRSRKTLFEAEAAATPPVNDQGPSQVMASSSVFIDARPGGTASDALRNGSNSPGARSDDATHLSATPTTTSAPFPGFIKPPAEDDPSTLEFLASQGALSLPSITLQCALIKAFVEIAHPRMPMVDLESFLRIVGSLDGSHGQISLLLYQAILFSGAAHVTLDALAEDGFADNKTLRRALYRRTEVLFELTSESDQLVLVQTALLLTFRGVSRSPKDRKDAWHWMNAAVTLAFANDMHHQSSYPATDTTKMRLMRRIWWSCYFRDKIQAIGLSRPSRLKESDHDVPMLADADLDIHVLTRCHCILGVGSLGPYRIDSLAESRDLCLQKVKLSLLMARVLDLREGPGLQEHAARVDEVSSELNQWLQALPNSCRPRPRGPDDSTDNASMAIITRRYLLSMAFYTTVYFLHRPRFIPDHQQRQGNTSPSVTISAAARETSKAAAMDAARNITQLAAELHHNHMDVNLPVSAITLICPAIFMHLLGMKSPSPDARNSAMLSFRVCLRIMERLREVYSVTDATIAYLEAALRNASSGTTLWPSISGIFQLNKYDRADLSAVLGLGTALHGPTEPVTSNITSQDAGFPGLESVLASSRAETPEEGTSRSEQGNVGPLMDVGTLCQDLGVNNLGAFIDPLLDLQMNENNSQSSCIGWTANMQAGTEPWPANTQDVDDGVSGDDFGMNFAWT